MVDAPRIEIRPEHMRQFTLHAQVSATRFALRREKRDLDLLQTYLLDAIFNLGCYGLHEGEYYTISYGNRRVLMWCYKVDRIECKLSPIIVDFTNYLYAFDILQLEGDPEEQKLLEYSREFYRGWKQQVSGPWRRTLSAEVGGDRDGLR